MLPPAEETPGASAATPGAIRPLRIGLWGDSHSAARFLTDTVVETLGFAPGEAVPGFVPPTVGVGGVRLPLAGACTDGRWTYQYAYMKPGLRTGKGLANMTSEATHGLVWLDFSQPPLKRTVAAVTLQVGPWPPDRPPVLAISADGGPEALAVLQDAAQGLVRVVPDRPLRSLAVRVVAGPLTLEGFAPEFTSHSGLTVDTFGIPGARARAWRNLDRDHLRERAGDPYDLIVLAYGTNEASEAAKDLAVYARDLRRDLQTVRAVHPHAACVLAGPPDRGVLVRPAKAGAARASGATLDALLRHARIHAMVAETQREVASEFDCGFWDWQAAMGGPGGIYRWFHASPRLAGRDLIHLTTDGYRLSGRKLGTYLRQHLQATGR